MSAEDDAPRTPLGEAIRRAYRSGEEDETLEPLVLTDSGGRPVGRIRAGGTVIFYDIRGEREVELTRSLVEPGFSLFPTAGNLDLDFTTMIEYAPSLPVRIAFPPQARLRNTLVETVGRAGLRVLKISESEKAVHVGFFFNGRSGEIFPWEDRIVVPSPEVRTNYDEAPWMSASEVATEVEIALEKGAHGLVIANFANVDVVGHLEKREAVLAAVESVDAALGRVVEAARRTAATLIVTADHGTVEQWLYPDGTVDTGHTSNPVPFILANFAAPEPGAAGLRPGGELADVAPTILDLLGVAKPAEMTGESLFSGRPAEPVSRPRVALVILDGWGHRDDAFGNLIEAAATPRFDALRASFPHAALHASGEAVGLPAGAAGNSEAGHLHLGTGRRVPLDRVRIDQAAADGNFLRNAALVQAMSRARKEGRPLHLMGIVSLSSSHGTIRHLFALLETARSEGVGEVAIHGFLGRRGERPESGARYVEMIEACCREIGIGRVVTVLGRYWSLDREENWDRVEKAYRALVFGEGRPVPVDGS